MMFKKARDVMGAIKRIPQLRKMYKALCSSCREAIKIRLRKEISSTEELLSVLCVKCRSLQK